MGHPSTSSNAGAIMPVDTNGCCNKRGEAPIDSSPDNTDRTQNKRCCRRQETNEREKCVLCLGLTKTVGCTPSENHKRDTHRMRMTEIKVGVTTHSLSLDNEPNEGGSTTSGKNPEHLVQDFNARDTVPNIFLNLLCGRNAESDKVGTATRQKTADFLDKYVGDLMQKRTCNRRYQQIVMDWFWVPQCWQEKVFKDAFFKTTLPGMFRLLPDPEARNPGTQQPRLECGIYLPYTLHILQQILKFQSELSPHYVVSFLRKHELNEVALYSGTHAISEKEMKNTYGKELNQEDIYCRIGEGDITSNENQGYHDALMDLVKNKLPNDVRMIKLTPRTAQHSCDYTTFDNCTDCENREPERTAPNQSVFSSSPTSCEDTNPHLIPMDLQKSLKELPSQSRKVLTMLAIATRPTVVKLPYFPIQKHDVKDLLELIQEENENSQDLDDILDNLAKQHLIKHDDKGYCSLVVKEDILSTHNSGRGSTSTVHRYRELLMMLHLHSKAFELLTGMCEHTHKEATREDVSQHATDVSVTVMDESEEDGEHAI